MAHKDKRKETFYTEILGRKKILHSTFFFLIFGKVLYLGSFIYKGISILVLYKKTTFPFQFYFQK